VIWKTVAQISNLATEGSSKTAQAGDTCIQPGRVRKIVAKLSFLYLTVYESRDICLLPILGYITVFPNVSGVFVPDSIIKPLAEVSKKERAKKSIELMAELIKELKPMCQGVHIMAMGWEKYVPDLLDACDL